MFIELDKTAFLAGNASGFLKKLYTWPAADSVGKFEEGLSEDDINYTGGKFPFMVESSACETGYLDGTVTVMAFSASSEDITCAPCSWKQSRKLL